MSRFLNAALLSAALVASVTAFPTALLADDHGVVVYKDKGHHDEHEWNDREARAYRMYTDEHHYHYREFSTLNPTEQGAYWDWRHHHSDADLKIDIH